MDALDMGKIVHELPSEHRHDVRPPTQGLGAGSIFQCDCGQQFVLEYMIPGDLTSHARWTEVAEDNGFTSLFSREGDHFCEDSSYSEWAYSVWDDVADVVEESWEEVKEVVVDLYERVASDEAVKKYKKQTAKAVRWGLRKLIDVTEKE